ncbi:type II toxin-antitoxin system HicA family toxin [Dyadobacter sp. OTU695]|uniref:type II toxin-antitoxin system HicA family toxin n=1 Tax=Dyadobacter sp. OTU695 TaxID=3043860 RepID=UPI00313C36A5
MKCSELLRILKSDGWFVVRQEGSHVMMRHSTKPGRLVVPDHGSKEVKKGLLAALLKMADIKTNKR